jgi:hypothetical protein
MPPEILILELVRHSLPLLVVLAIGYPFARVLARALGHRLDRARLDAAEIGGVEALREVTEIHARLARIEASVDAIAVEVERSAEAQRFTARLLTERVPTPKDGRR